ncbi:MAG TPA: type II secretion system F family protein [Actinomycetota bacterium]|nr:type II secretion system F family protein [Actinomycetota bacterium]
MIRRLFALTRRRSAQPDPSRLPDAIRRVRDGVRGGLSLNQAVRRGADGDGSPLQPVVVRLDSGQPLADALEETAACTASTEVACCCLVLAVQSRTGGDPIPALASLEERIRNRVSAAREASALSAQARMSSRALLMLTPGFLLVLALVDPVGMRRALAGPGKLAMGAGLVLQMLGGLWIRRIVRPPSECPRSRLSGVPVLRALPALVSFGRRGISPVAAEVAQTAEVLSLVLGAGLSPSRGLEVVASSAQGSFGAALRGAVLGIRAGTARSTALADSMSSLQDPDATRFADVFTSSDKLGVPLASSLRAMSDDIVESLQATASEEVRKSSVRVLVPLGLLILPSFVLSCLVPLLLGGLEGISL